MRKIDSLRSFKQRLVVWGLAWCKTILQSYGKSTLSLILAMSLVSCGPGTTNNYVTNQANGGDKNDPGGYGGGSTGDGGGGQGISCSAETKNPALRSKLFVRDIFEGIYNSKLNIRDLVLKSSPSEDQVSSEAVNLLLASLRQYFGPATGKLEIGNAKFWNDFVSKINFVDDETTLYPSQDANSPIVLPKGCKIVQIAFWQDSAGSSENGVLYVDRKHWAQLDQINKIALLAHEYFFKEARKAGYKNSDFVRSKVGRLLSVDGLSPLFQNWVASSNPLTKDNFPALIKGFKYCKGTSESDPSAILHMYQYEGKDGKQHFAFPYLASSTVNFSSLQNREFTLTWPGKTGPEVVIYSGRTEA